MRPLPCFSTKVYHDTSILSHILVLQALPTNRQLLEIEALLCCNPAFVLQALPTTGALLYYSAKKTVAIPHSCCRLFRPRIRTPLAPGSLTLQSRIRAAGSSDCTCM